MRSWTETFSQRDSQYATSMLRDLERGGPTEVEHILGFMLNKAREANIVHQTLLLAYTHIKAFEQRCVARHGGEILKFIGEGLLAVFPLSQPSACANLLHAVTEARQAMVALNEKNGEAGRAPLNYGERSLDERDGLGQAERCSRNCCRQQSVTAG